MSDPNDTLLRELLTLAQSQRMALKEGRLDEVLTILGQRKNIIDRIKVVVRLTENQKMAVKDITAIDADISTAVQCSMSDISSRLGSIDNVRAYINSISSAVENKQVGVSI